MAKTTRAKPLHVTVSKTELSAGSVVQGVVHLDPSIVTTPSPNALCLELVGREISHVSHYSNHLHQQRQQRIHKEERIFLNRQKTWTSQDVLAKQESLSSSMDDEATQRKLTWEFSIPLPNDLPPSFSEEIPYHSVINEPSSKCQVDYSLQVTYGNKLRSEPCSIQIRRLIHQALSDVVSLQVAEVLERAQPMLCGLYEQTHQTFVLSTTTSTTTAPSELVWSPLQQSAVTIRLTDAKGLLTAKASGTQPWAPKNGPWWVRRHKFLYESNVKSPGYQRGAIVSCSTASLCSTSNVVGAPTLSDHRLECGAVSPFHTGLYHDSSGAIPALPQSFVESVSSKKLVFLLNVVCKSCCRPGGPNDERRSLWKVLFQFGERHVESVCGITNKNRVAMIRA
eukprot:scaffold742_cov165-Amphora_coffeaeformis.AAC.6